MEICFNPHNNNNSYLFRKLNSSIKYLYLNVKNKKMIY